MSYTKEVKIGLVFSISLLVLFFGFYLLKGANVFSGENNYYIIYDNIQGLQLSSKVQIKGMSVGRVATIDLTNDGKIVVMLAINKKTKLTKGSKATLNSIDLLGNKAINLSLGESDELLNNQDTLIAGIEGGIIDAMTSEIVPLLKELRFAVVSLDTVLIGLHGILDVATREQLRQSIANLNTTMANFSKISNTISNESNHISSVIDNTNSITANLAKNNERINKILDNIASTTDQLSRAPLEATITDLQKTINQLQSVVAKVDGTNGSLGLMVNDKSLYNNLNGSLQTLNALMTDIEAHPSKYINVSIFGRNKGKK